MGESVTTTIPLTALRGQDVALFPEIRPAPEEVRSVGIFARGAQPEQSEPDSAACYGRRHGVAVDSRATGLFANLLASAVRPRDEVLAVPKGGVPEPAP